MTCALRIEGHGLSPRVRGNPGLQLLLVVGLGSIPACAGEPTRPAGRSCRPTVYPRVCGGTPPSAFSIVMVSGLSPRVRGNRARQTVWDLRQRSIPACAGEPLAIMCYTGKGRVYPRVCGGTLALTENVHRRQGLSPRVRGNLVMDFLLPLCKRSIPACAGEPSMPGGLYLSAEVYPRVCGGTRNVNGRRILHDGLSPRVRGNPPRVVGMVGLLGSIPACAGEPTAMSGTRLPFSVYPRVCGGTTPIPSNDDPVLGLSPRVRGNLGE